MKRAERERLNRLLNEHLNTIHETLQVLDQSPAPSAQRTGWKDVVQMGEQLSKQATNVGMLWTGETQEVAVLEDNMFAFFNALQGLLLLSHGSTVGAGPTLSACIHASIKQVVDCSFVLMKDTIATHGPRNKAQKHSIPQLVGTVWEACSALKKTPSTNITAIGRALTQSAVSMKDVLREMKELKSSSPDSEVDDEVSAETESNLDDTDDMGDLGNDLSPEEMKVAQLTTDVVSQTLVVIKELIRSITGLVKLEASGNSSDAFIGSLERILKLCQEIGLQVDELGASLYPPQEISSIRGSLKIISSNTNEMMMELENLKGSTEDYKNACDGLKTSMEHLASELGSADSIMQKMENLAVSDD
ncbi:unnamed protein product [Cuscuta campestris]|uniref:Uncharacterized protein n=2 Tax=Cuscuta sect. Cleistogrammica TaxID=1824901 RepID=A0A484LPF7_9ASTE|nr:hypothetical protein DM860_008365 [Cuscuta australis]VFQ78167.1 unnamed protein product [Cuscuta campestris]